MKMYCENCCLLFDAAKCPECGRRGREVRDEDYCLLTEKQEMWAEMLADALRQNEIEALLRSVNGAALSLFTGPAGSFCQVFVPYRDMEKAAWVEESLFGPNAVFADEDAEDTNEENGSLPEGENEENENG